MWRRSLSAAVGLAVVPLVVLGVLVVPAMEPVAGGRVVGGLWRGPPAEVVGGPGSSGDVAGRGEAPRVRPAVDDRGLAAGRGGVRVDVLPEPDGPPLDDPPPDDPPPDDPPPDDPPPDDLPPDDRLPGDRPPGAAAAPEPGPGPVGPWGPGPVPGARYAWPLHPAPVVRMPFAAPAHRYARGHRGVDLGAEPGRPVLAARGGTVVFAGPVGGRGVVSIRHDDGLRTTYQPVRPVVATGATVGTGQPIGLLLPGRPGCPEPACLHWGVRRDPADYLDPLVLLKPPRVRLLPVPDPWPLASRSRSGPLQPPGRRDRRLRPLPRPRGGRHRARQPVSAV